MSYIDLRDALGHLVARYDPQREILEIRARGVVSVFDLRQLREQRAAVPVEAAPQPPLPQCRR